MTYVQAMSTILEELNMEPVTIGDLRQRGAEDEVSYIEVRPAGGGAGDLWIVFKDGSKPRFVGVYKGKDFVKVFRDPKKHIFRQNRSYGVSAILLEQGKFKELLVEQADGSLLGIDREDAIRHSSHRSRFQKYEYQLFIPLTAFKEIKE